MSDETVVSVDEQTSDDEGARVLVDEIEDILPPSPGADHINSLPVGMMYKSRNSLSGAGIAIVVAGALLLLGLIGYPRRSDSERQEKAQTEASTETADRALADASGTTDYTPSTEITEKESTTRVSTTEAKTTAEPKTTTEKEKTTEEKIIEKETTTQAPTTTEEVTTSQETYTATEVAIVLTESTYTDTDYTDRSISSDDYYSSDNGSGNEAAAETYVEETPSYTGSTVWVSRTGSKYHSNPDCSGMNDPIPMSEQEAINSGRSACSKCY